MINLISGTVEVVSSKELAIRMGPIGLTCFVPSTESLSVGSTITLHTYFHWSAEQGPALYGFESPFARSVFMIVIGCSGVGPKLGLSVLSDLGAIEFVQAIQSDDTKSLSSVSGIGSKKAEQILVQARHKISNLIDKGELEVGSQGAIRQWNELTQVLVSLHYSRFEIDHALKQLKQEPNSSQMPFDRMMRKVLSFLAKKG